jgi:hypothetical protein
MYPKNGQILNASTLRYTVPLLRWQDFQTVGTEWG